MGSICAMRCLIKNTSNYVHFTWTDHRCKYTILISIHTICRERNNRRHEKEKAPFTATQLIQQFIDKHVRNRLSTIRSMRDRRYEGGIET